MVQKTSCGLQKIRTETRIEYQEITPQNWHIQPHLVVYFGTTDVS